MNAEMQQYGSLDNGQKWSKRKFQERLLRLSTGRETGCYGRCRKGEPVKLALFVNEWITSYKLVAIFLPYLLYPSSESVRW